MTKVTLIAALRGVKSGPGRMTGGKGGPKFVSCSSFFVLAGQGGGVYYGDGKAHAHASWFVFNMASHGGAFRQARATGSYEDNGHGHLVDQYAFYDTVFMSNRAWSQSDAAPIRDGAALGLPTHDAKSGGEGEGCCYVF